MPWFVRYEETILLVTRFVPVIMVKYLLPFAKVLLVLMLSKCFFGREYVETLFSSRKKYVRT